MANVKVFEKYVKGYGQGHTFKIYGTLGKALSQGTDKQNMKALSHRIKKLWWMLKFFKSRSKITVKVTDSKFMVTTGEALS